MFDLPAHRHYAETRLMASFEPCEERDMAVMLFDACEAVEALQAEVERLQKLITDADLPGLERDHNADLHEMVRIRAENARLRKALTAIGKCSLDYCKIKQCDGPCAHKDARAALAPATSKETPPIFGDNCQHKWEPAERHMEVGPGGWFCTKCKGICNL